MKYNSNGVVMMNKTRSLFELLKKREILDILIGDISFGELELKNKSGKNITMATPHKVHKLEIKHD